MRRDYFVAYLVLGFFGGGIITTFDILGFFYNPLFCLANLIIFPIAVLCTYWEYKSYQEENF